MNQTKKLYIDLYAQKQLGRSLTKNELELVCEKVLELEKSPDNKFQNIPELVEEALFELSSEVKE